MKSYEKGLISSVTIAEDYANLDEKDKAFEWLEKAFVERDGQLKYLKTNFFFDNINSDPRLKDLLQRIGLPL